MFKKVIKIFTIYLLLSIHGVYSQVIIRDCLGMCSEQEDLITTIGSVRETTTSINDQMSNMMEIHLTRQAVSACLRYLIKANQHILHNYLNRILDDSLLTIQQAATRAKHRFTLTIQRLQAHTETTFSNFQQCCSTNSQYRLIEQTKKEIENCIQNKLVEADTIYGAIKTKLLDVENVIRSMPLSLANCLATENCKGIIPIANCLRLIAGDILSATPTTMQLVNEAQRAGEVLLNLTDSLYNIITEKILTTKAELSLACIEVGICLNQINGPIWNFDRNSF